MAARVIDGRAVAARLQAEVGAGVVAFRERHGRVPGLATVLVGEDPGSAIYVRRKQEACAEVGIEGASHELAADAAREEVIELLRSLNADERVSGVLLQLPLPGHLDAGELTNLIAADKDVDGLTVASAGRLASGLPGLRPCTPAGVMDLLTESGAEPAGAEAVVVGRSNLFGKPMAQLLLAADATVTVCHSRTRDLAGTCRRAEVLIVAVGRPRMVGRDWVKPGATVIDVGINRTDAGLTGDVDFAAVEPVAGAITPVPGGVGPMTIACLLRNTLRAAEAAAAAR